MIANIIKSLVTIAIFFFLLQHVDLERVVNVLKKADVGMMVAAFALQMTSTVMAAYRWYLIMRLLVFRESFGFYLRSYFKGSFFNQVLPGSIGGDAVRIIELARMGYAKRDAFYGIFVDRVVGLVGLLVLNLFANNLYYGSFPTWLYQLINLIALGGIAGFAVILNLHHLRFLQKYRFVDLVYRLGKRMQSLYGDKKILMKHIAVSVVVHLLSVLSVFALALSVGVTLPLHIFLIAVPPVFLLTIVPVSLAGWGVREGAMVGILMLVGVEKEKILAISILYGVILILSSLPGAYFWIRSKTTKKDNRK